MNDTQHKKTIEQALHHFSDGPLAENARNLLNTLGYHSDLMLDLEPNTAEGFIEAFNPENKLNPDKALTADWVSIDLLFQLTGDELTATEEQEQLLFDPNVNQVDNTIMESYLFFSLALRGSKYTRTQLSRITREINKLFLIPVMVLFQHGQTLTFAVIDRHLHKRDESKDVLEKVTLIKDINFTDPHRAHIEILFDLSLGELYRQHQFTNFPALHQAWKDTLDSSELNRRFFNELANWYFWAVEQVTFPEDAGEDVMIRNATSIIRLITRLIFVWFIKEKGLVPDALFNRKEIDEILMNTDPHESTYYKAILQNLFFATLNQEMNTVEKPDNRKFRHRAKQSKGRDQHRMVHSLYRYEEYFKHPKEALSLFETIPFLNGGLFECLDKHDKDDSEKVLRIDGFSDERNIPLSVPNHLFFSDEQTVDLNTAYGTKGVRYKVHGLVDILHRYKFTVTENTPIEEEVALDPELLGKVFENLLAAYNPETNTTARKQTGSFYTPREIVNYMTDESLVAYLKNELASSPLAEAPLMPQPQEPQIEKNLRHLLAYNDEPHKFSDAETEALIRAIDTLKILDPACGSGAFPMGILHKLVFILAKLDPGNVRWKDRQIEKASEIPDPIARDDAIDDIEAAFERNELNYGRKLYLIENCIYGVDIQPIATQIAKLRFFISLVVDAKIDDSRENCGVRPLPNLETKFGAANTLLGVEKPEQLTLRNPQIDRKEKELEDVRRRHFTARTPGTKAKYRDLDDQIRTELIDLLKGIGFPHETTEKIARWSPYDQNASAGFFDPEWMFGVRDGFDLVIGNPPYISHDKIPKQLKTAIKAHYQSYQPFADVYCYFIEKAIELQNKRGILSLITSNSYLRAEYGAPIRELLKSKNMLLSVLSIEDSQVFESVIVNVAIIVSRKPTNLTDDFCVVVNSPFSGNSFEEFVKSDSFNYPQAYFGSKSWNLVEPKLVELQRKLESSGKTLEQLNTKIRLGVATGSNEAYLIDEDKKRELCEKNPVNAEIIKPILRGRDISRYSYTLARQYILLAKNGVNVERDYPEIYKHLESFGDKFRNRGAQGQHWTNLRACSFYDDFKKEKIVWIELTDLGQFALCNEEVYLLNSAYFLLPPSGMDSKFLLGVLNSRAIRFYLGLVAETSGMGTSRWINNYVKDFPIPVVATEQQAPIIQLTDQILATKRTDPDVDVTALENEINQVVYSLYNLTPEEIAIVENKK